MYPRVGLDHGHHILTKKYATHGYRCETLLYHPDGATVGNAAETSIRKLLIIGRTVFEASCHLACMFPSLGHDLSASRIVKSRREASRVDCPILDAAPMSYGLALCTVKQEPRTGRRPGHPDFVAHASPSGTTRLWFVALPMPNRKSSVHQGGKPYATFTHVYAYIYMHCIRIGDYALPRHLAAVSHPKALHILVNKGLRLSLHKCSCAPLSVSFWLRFSGVARTQELGLQRPFCPASGAVRWA